MAGINREYRDRLFKFIFGNEKNRGWTLKLYNAINNSEHTDENAITFTTVDDAVYMSMKNDVSFLIANTMTMIEQQSSVNPNMPMRFLLYAGEIYSRYATINKILLYSSSLKKFPTPKCICFYNGKTEKDDREVLSLSSCFEEGDSDIELKVTMMNVNYGHNQELLKKCKPLKEYSWFIDAINRNQRELGKIEDAVNAALREMPDDFEIKQFLMANKAEVTKMCITEYNEAETMNGFKQEGIEEGAAIGEAKGEVKGTIKTLLGLVHDGLLSEANATKRADMSVAEFRKLVAQYS